MKSGAVSLDLPHNTLWLPRVQMKHGAAYLHSREKRIFDLILANSARPVETMARLAANLTFSPEGPDSFYQTRVGQDDEPFEVKKLFTLDDDGVPLSDLADWYRTRGLDELSQLEQVREGSMSVFGRRPLLEDEYQWFRSRAEQSDRGRRILNKYDRVVVPAKPGIISSYALATHQGEPVGPLQYFRMEIKDHIQASLPHDLLLARQCLEAMVKGKLTSHKVHVIPQIAS